MDEFLTGDSDLPVCVEMDLMTIIGRLSSLKKLGKVRKRKKRMEMEMTKSSITVMTTRKPYPY